MDIDLSVLRGLESEKDIKVDLALKAIEDALLVAYHRSGGAAVTARVEVDRGSGHVTVWAAETGPEGEVLRVRRHASRFRPDRGHHRAPGHPAAVAGRRGRAHLGRVRGPRGRHRGRGDPAGQGPACGPGRPGQGGGHPAAHRTGTRRAARARGAAALLRAAR